VKITAPQPDGVLQALSQSSPGSESRMKMVLLAPIVLVVLVVAARASLRRCSWCP